MNLPTLAHGVNFFRASPGAEHDLAQRVTQQAIRNAKEFSRERVPLSLVAAVFSEDAAIVPDVMDQTVTLNRSIRDFIPDPDAKKLPLLGDILSALYIRTNADYMIFTNADIAPLPHFYLSIAHLVRHGYDAFVITRRTIGSDIGGTAPLPLLYAQAGDEHPGCDCFVFRRSLLPRFVLADVAFGCEFVALALRANLLVLAERFHIFRDKHLTFHLGDDRSWLRFFAGSRHNEREMERIFPALIANCPPPRREPLSRLERDFQERKIRWRERHRESEPNRPDRT